MSEGYLSVLINRQIPDSVWLEKGEKPLAGTAQDPFVVVFEQHFADSDAAHRFVVGKLAESGVEEWNGGQFRGATTRQVISLVSEAAKAKSLGQPNHANPSLADLPALAEPAANVSSNKYKVTPADYVIIGGVVIIALLVVAAMTIGSHPSPNQSGASLALSQSSQVSDSTPNPPPAFPIAITDVRTYWLVGDPTDDDRTMCTPAVAFSVKNNSGKDMSYAIFTASFKRSEAKTVFGTGMTMFGGGDLPPGYSRQVAVTSTIGRVSLGDSCSSENLPKLSVSVSVTAPDLRDAPLIPDKTINNEASAMYVNTLSTTDPPAILPPPHHDDIPIIQGPLYNGAGEEMK